MGKWFRGSFGWVVCRKVAKLFPGKDVMLHKNNCGFKPRLGDTILFQLAENQQGDPQAVNVIRSAANIDSKESYKARASDEPRLSSKITSDIVLCPRSQGAAQQPRTTRALGGQQKGIVQALDTVAQTMQQRSKDLGSTNKGPGFCKRSGCDQPTWNGMPGYCSRNCKTLHAEQEPKD